MLGLVPRDILRFGAENPHCTKSSNGTGKCLVKKSPMDPFRKACGAIGPLHFQLDGRNGVETGRRILDQPFALIGRDSRCDILLSGEEVSRRHAYVQFLGGTLFCVDLESRTGTHWDGHTRGHGWVYHDQVIRIGRHKLRLMNPAAESEVEILKNSSPFAVSEGELPVYSSSALEIHGGPDGPVLWPLNRPLVLIGSSHECKVQLHGSGVSRVHCSLVSSPKGVWVVDLRGSGGVLLNEERVRHARLSFGDVMRVGSFSIRYCRRALAAKEDQSQVIQVVRAPQDDESGPEPKAWRLASQEQSSATPVPATAPSDSLPAPLLSQFSQMQSQMFDQFQQGMLMMFQMFGTLQKEHMELVREELSHIQEVSREIHQVQRELLKQTPRPGAPSAIAPLRPEEPRRLSGKLAAPVSPQPIAPAPDEVRPKDKIPAAHRPLEQKPVEESNRERPTTMSDAHGAEMHAWLCARIENLKEERQSRWQRIMGFFGSKPK